VGFFINPKQRESRPTKLSEGKEHNQGVAYLDDGTSEPRRTSTSGCSQYCPAQLGGGGLPGVLSPVLRLRAYNQRLRCFCQRVKLGRRESGVAEHRIVLGESIRITRGCRT